MAEVHAPSEGRLLEIDLFRFVAALGVVAFHFTFQGTLSSGDPTLGEPTGVDYPSWLDAITRFGYLGVDLFFIISGFVVLMSAWGRRPSRFVGSRVSRLYPAYWVGVTASVLAMLWVDSRQYDVSLSEYLANMTMLQSWVGVPHIDPVYWTLRFELTFYFSLLVLVMVGLTRRSVTAFMVGWLVLDVAVRLVELPGPVGTVADKLLMPGHSHYFVAGMALFLWYRDGRSWLLGAVLAAAYGKAMYEGYQYAQYQADLNGQPINPWVADAVITSLMLLMFAVADGRLSGFRYRYFPVLGALTYPVYLLHDRVGSAIIDRLAGHLNRWAILALALVVVLLLTWLVHRYIERPNQPRLRRWIAGRLAPVDGLAKASR